MEFKELPDSKMEFAPIPNPDQPSKPLPKTGVEANTVYFGKQRVEIKPVKMKYMRNGTASFYHVLDRYPVSDVVIVPAGAVDPDRSGDKCIMDWLIAATDNEKLILKHYDELDADTIHQILMIFKRINHITEKEEAAKNRETGGKGE